MFCGRCFVALLLFVKKRYGNINIARRGRRCTNEDGWARASDDTRVAAPCFVWLPPLLPVVRAHAGDRAIGFGHVYV